MTTDKKEKCELIIHGAAASGAGAAALLAQIPGADNVALVGIEVGMVIALGNVFDVTINESFAKSIIAGTAGTLVGRGISQFLFGWVPVFGNAINAVTASAVIEGLGWTIAKDFDSGKNLPPN